MYMYVCVCVICMCLLDLSDDLCVCGWVKGGREGKVRAAFSARGQTAEFSPPNFDDEFCRRVAATATARASGRSLNASRNQSDQLEQAEL